MKTYEGKSVFGGVAIGKVLVYKKGEQQVKRYRVSDTKAEIERFEGAKAEQRRKWRNLKAFFRLPIFSYETKKIGQRDYSSIRSFFWYYITATS